MRRLSPDGLIGFRRGHHDDRPGAQGPFAAGLLDGETFTLTGVVKGAGMIRPDVATMLCFIVTDARVGAGDLQAALAAGADRSFNCITVDGDTSTNDTILLMASGASPAVVESAASKAAFQSALDDLMLGLAKWVVKDAEGSNKLVEIAVRGAQSDADAPPDGRNRRPFASGEDRLVRRGRELGPDSCAAAGRSGACSDPGKVDVFIGPIQMVACGSGCGKDVEAEATQVLKQAEFTIAIDLHLGEGRAMMYTCDFSIDYVKINADYRS